MLEHNHPQLIHGSGVAAWSQRGVRPLIRRCLLLVPATTIAGLHAVLQIAFGWAGEHMHRFVVHAREYGIAYLDGPSFRDDPRRVRLGDLGLRLSEQIHLITTTSLPGGVLICGWSRSRAPSRAGTVRSVPVGAVPVPGGLRRGASAASGKLARRPEWDDLLDYSRSGDKLVITHLSRMARSVGISPRSQPAPREER